MRVVADEQYDLGWREVAEWILLLLVIGVLVWIGSKEGQVR